MLSAILSKIGLSDAKYARYRNYNRRVGATVVFWPSLLHLSAMAEPRKIQYSPTRDIDEAEQNAGTDY